MNSKQSKLLGICLLVTLMFSALSMSAQTVTKTFSNESLRNVLKEVERQPEGDSHLPCHTRPRRVD